MVLVKLNNFWFEFRKALNSGDGYNWSLAPGETIAAERTDDLWLGIYDATVPTYFQYQILLRLHGLQETEP